ncbi:MAG: pilus assembly FimT family protein [Opitutales bacterium]|jgi:prepilin-type N-terminal cleavage/methylation domain-containing protein
MEKHDKGYTLIELLVVLALMTIAFSFVIVNTMNNDGMSLKSSQRILSAVAQGAKGQAIMKQSSARLIIYADQSEGSDANKYLRYVGIVTQDPSNPRKWIAGTDGTYLPKGIYFMPELSQIANGRGKRIGKMYLEYPRIQSQFNDRRSGEEYYYYEFNANGTMGANFVNAWLIFGVGDLIPKGNRQLDVSFDNPSNELLKSGLIFRKVGSTTLVTDADQINRITERNDR